jgi:hypothetical protein
LKGFAGRITKTATVVSDDPRNPEIKLQVEGNVKQLIEVQPSPTVLFRGTADQVAESVIDVVGTKVSFHITATESNLNDQIVHSIQTVEEGKHYKLTIRNKLKQGFYGGYVKLVTDVPQKPEIMIRVNGMIEGEITVRPQVVLIGKFGAEQPPRSGRVEVRSSHNKPFHITKLSYDEQVMSVSQQSLDGETAYSLEIEPKLEAITPGGRQQTLISIETDAAPGDTQTVQVHILNSADHPQQSAAPAPK